MKTKGLMPVIEKKDKAVSPIIATILLVAITVILASTLYLALGGFFSTKTTSTPTVAIGATNTSSSTTAFTYSITIGSPSSNTISWSSTAWIVTLGSTLVTVSWSSATTGWTATLTSTETTAGLSSIGVSAPTGTYVAGGEALTLNIAYTAYPPGYVISTLAFNLIGSNGGQMGTISL